MRVVQDILERFENIMDPGNRSGGCAVNPGNLVFVKDSNMLPRSTPLILMDKYHDGNSLYFEVLDPRTGHRYHYQEHNLSEVPE